MSEWMDDGYPTDEALKKIAEWPHDDFHGLMEFIEPMWQYGDCGYWTHEEQQDEVHDRPVDAYYLSTAGWSGNEDIIGALRENTMFWMMNWVQNKRGGHYTFYLRQREPQEQSK